MFGQKTFEKRDFKEDNYMIKVCNLSKKYNKKYVLKDFSYNFETGAYLIKGKSGKGKTTLLNLLSGEDNVYDGCITVKGSIFYLKDKGNLVSDLTVKEHFKLFEKIQNKRFIYYCDIRDLLNKKIKHLSLGELQLVQINIALNCDEEILLLDEPFSALSYENKKIVSSLIESIKEKKTIIFTSHEDSMFEFTEKVFIKRKRVNDNAYKMNVKKVEKEFKFSYLSLYFRKTFFKRIFFLFSLILSLFSYFFVDDYLDNSFDEYIGYFKESEGTVINKKNTIYSLNENLFYEVVKELSPYVLDYNVNYYNSLLYDYDLTVDDYYIDNAFVLSSVRYIEENLEDNAFVLGINYQKFCGENLIFGCDKSYVNSLLINKKLNDFPYTIEGVIETEETVVFSSKRFFKIYENNDYDEYYFDIEKDNKEMLFKKIGKSTLLSNFEFTLIGENEDHQRYKAEVKEYKYFNDINYNEYLVCLDNGYDCNNYMNHFNTLVKIDDFKDINLLELSVYKGNLNQNEIVVSSKLLEVLNKGVGDAITLIFEYKGTFKEIKLYIKDIIYCNDYILFQNSEWSYSFFKDEIGLDFSDLRIKDILVYEDVKKGDYKGNNEYNDLIEEFKNFFINMKKSIQCISLVLTSSSIVILVVIEVIQTKFKREYFNYLKFLNVKIKKGTLVP